MRKLDQSEKDILRLLQDDATLPLAAIAKKVHLSPTPCWRRMQKLREEGIVRKQVALVDPEKVNVGVNVFVSIRIGRHDSASLKAFSKSLQGLPQIVEFYRMSGDVDVLLRIVVPDIRAYDVIYQQLMSIARLHSINPDVSSSFALEQVKYTTNLPLDYA